ncbi:hypothetical protein [Corynebacterium sanguinis]|uniref:hypothetical protein n=1 Tax=Corynebacterium sanguinis TaxID=2594913 RepID=UPI002867C3F4|nr:hypothetical protein [Corynebacterium sanguinis]
MTTTYPSTVTVGIGALTIDEVVAVARYGASVEIDPAALAATFPAGSINEDQHAEVVGRLSGAARRVAGRFLV